MNDYRQIRPDSQLESDLRALVRLAIAEDLRADFDWTTICLIDDGAEGVCQIVPRQAGLCAGLALLPWIIDEFDADLRAECLLHDGGPLTVGQPLAILSGNVRDLLTAERTILNILSRLCGVATLTRQFVNRIAASGARLYDTRKTTPGWRLLEKYAVRCGGGHNHRSGLYDGFLIKDNHLALGGSENRPLPAGEAVRRAVAWRGAAVNRLRAPLLVEVEIDSLDPFREVLDAAPDIVLLDNFELHELRQAVAIRDAANPAIELEASGGVTIDTIAQIAATGVDRISSGALTHQATSLDLGLDWKE